MEKVILVTGGSRGIGAATARLAAAEGYCVCLSYVRDREAAESVVASIESAGGKALACRADVGREEDILELFGLVERWGRLDALVNNAGILEKQCRLGDLTWERLERVLRVNTIGAMICCREAARRMESGGAIVNVGSVASRLGAPGEYVDYAASKGALDSMTIGLSKELAPRNIRVNAVRPGFIYTDIHACGGEPGRVDRVAGGLPMRRGGTVEEVAQAIIWLLSEKASFVTGTFVDMGGGL